MSHQDYAYGADGGIFTCIDLKTGERKWKGGRYGKGQVLLLENSGLLLIAAEQGQVVLLRADSNEHAEVASFKALEGKTWSDTTPSGLGSMMQAHRDCLLFTLQNVQTPDPALKRRAILTHPSGMMTTES